MIITEDPRLTMIAAGLGPKHTGPEYRQLIASYEAAPLESDEEAELLARIAAIDAAQADFEHEYGQAWLANARRISAERGYPDATIRLSGDLWLDTATTGADGTCIERAIWQAAHDATPVPEIPAAGGSGTPAHL